MLHFFPPWKQQKTARSSNAFRGYRIIRSGKNGLNFYENNIVTKVGGL